MRMRGYLLIRMDAYYLENLEDSGESGWITGYDNDVCLFEREK